MSDREVEAEEVCSIMKGVIFRGPKDLEADQREVFIQCLRDGGLQGRGGV